jgi:chemotaxis protein methyltransferase CheR
MQFYADVLGLPDTAFTILRDLIHERTGLFYDNGKRDILVDKLSPRVIECGLESFLDYYYLLKYDASAEAEWARLMDALSVGETYFWREVDQVQALVNAIVPAHFAESDAPLRIWSAACASGEEPLSIAIALNEAGWWQRGAPIHICASDGSQAAIARARQGIYRRRSFRSLPEALWQKYFLPEGEETWRVRPEMHEKVNWRVANLMDHVQVAPLANVSVIFCRNAFIYFSEAAVRETAQWFYERMRRPGYLFVGYAESLLKLETKFELEDIEGAFVYVKS